MAVSRSRTGNLHRRQVARVDRRWLLMWLGSFLASLALLFGAYRLYKATGPHPEVTILIRRLKHHARWLIPGLKRKPNARPDARLETDRPRHAAVGRPRG